MLEITPWQIRNFRLRTHQLDSSPSSSLTSRIIRAAGICGIQNSPPGAWEISLFSRVPDCTQKDLDHLLTEEKSLLQAWSFRGAPVVFPASESASFLQALTARDGEEWIYTHGITLALDFLSLPFPELLEMLIQVLPGLDQVTIAGKSSLDQTLAQWMLPLLPASRRDLWNCPSMYGDPQRQTVGGAVVSFLLRPCSFLGLVVFGRREEGLPTFTSYKNWTGKPYCPLEPDEAARRLVRKYLHAYGPASSDQFASWLGCTKKQGRRMWDTLSGEMEPVSVLGKKAYVLKNDLEDILSPVLLKRPLLMLGPHDPYLDGRDRLILQPDPALHRQIWKTVSNPGAILREGEIVGIWNCRKKPKGLEIHFRLFSPSAAASSCSGSPETMPLPCRQDLSDMAQQYAAFRGEPVFKLDFS